MYIRNYIETNSTLDAQIDFLNDYLDYNEIKQEGFSNIELVGNKKHIPSYLNANCMFIIWVTDKNLKYVLVTNLFLKKRAQKENSLFDKINLKKGKYKYRPKV